ncbi:hypothetical protein BOX15_Mlig016073g1 [Macrostomum lignano]|uniref:Uncharacterized protein n=1 Tax=Macrostomum lignano TaxID=282301 RepID=A0A267FXK5_9PLAT|nr:hypothetical protein BOX15_Mlig008906g2 [Macrostomum lignano]PAA83213.1 hypothetical protein BOX15_Mlig016073g1 [Macrostomum lignano]
MSEPVRNLLNPLSSEHEDAVQFFEYIMKTRANPRNHISSHCKLKDYKPSSLTSPAMEDENIDDFLKALLDEEVPISTPPPQEASAAAASSAPTTASSAASSSATSSAPTSAAPPAAPEDEAPLRQPTRPRALGSSNKRPREPSPVASNALQLRVDEPPHQKRAAVIRAQAAAPVQQYMPQNCRAAAASQERRTVQLPTPSTVPKRTARGPRLSAAPAAPAPAPAGSTVAQEHLENTLREAMHAVLRQHGEQLEKIAHAIRQYLMRIGRLRLDQALPQRSQVWTAIRALRDRLEQRQAVTVLQYIALGLRRAMPPSDETVQHQLLAVEMRWLFAQLGWPYYRELPDPCNF